MVARIPAMAGSANAAIRSAARSWGVASRRRVVGYSTGSRPKSARSPPIACSCTAGGAKDGDSTATRSPGLSVDGGLRSGRMWPVLPLPVETDHRVFQRLQEVVGRVLGVQVHLFLLVDGAVDAVPAGPPD